MNAIALKAKAEFYLILSRCFMPPTAPEIFPAMKDVMADELREIAPVAGYVLDQPVGAYTAALAAIPNPLTLLQVYSGLFLAPPRKVHLYSSVHIDGTILGRSSDEVEAFYRRYGMERADDFMELHDHLGAELEFLALLYARAAAATEDARTAILVDCRDFSRRHLLSWLPRLRQSLEQALAEESHATLYLSLVDLLLTAQVTEAGELSANSGPTMDPAELKADAGVATEMANCRLCGLAIASAARIRRVRKVLEKEGIDTGHLDLCPKCRGIGLAPGDGLWSNRR